MPKPGYRKTEISKVSEGKMLKLRDERVERIFRELKEKGLIDKSRKLKVKRRGNMKGDRFTNTIKYNPEFTKILSENSIRFGLLHEEGHLRVRQFSYVILLFFGGLLIVGLALIIFQINNLLIRFGVSLLVMLQIIFLLNIFRKPLELDEYRADEFAAKILYEKFGLSPYKVFSKFLDELDRVVRSEKDPNYLIYLLYAITEYHPTNMERLERLRQLENLWGSNKSTGGDS